jgi:hypothetical protein
VSDDNAASKNYYKRIAAEYAELDDPRVKAQMRLDAHWQRRLDERARARRSEIPEKGDYSPVARACRELDDAQQEADWRYTRGRDW